MGSIKQEAQKVKFNANEKVRNKIENTKSIFSSAINNFNAKFHGLISGDIVGIDIDHVPAMKTAIEKYVNELQYHLDQLQPHANTAKAFKGKYAKSVQDFVQAVSECCNRLISELMSFSESLDRVVEAYNIHDEDVATDISNQTDKLRQDYLSADKN